MYTKIINHAAVSSFKGHLWDTQNHLFKYPNDLDQILVFQTIEVIWINWGRFITVNFKLVIKFYTKSESNLTLLIKILLF